MTSGTRKELLRVVEQLCNRYPHWRLGQLVANVSGWADADVWDVEDEQLLEAARKHLESRPRLGKDEEDLELEKSPEFWQMIRERRRETDTVSLKEFKDELDAEEKHGQD